MDDIGETMDSPKGSSFVAHPEIMQWGYYILNFNCCQKQLKVISKDEYRTIIACPFCGTKILKCWEV